MDLVLDKVLLKRIFVQNPEQTVKPAPVFKPIQNWHKIMKVSSEKPLSKSTVDQVFQNILKPYEPTVPKNTSARCIEALSDAELEQLSCPGMAA